jgi:hypothetical protein
MLNSETLEVAIGMAGLFLMMALVGAALQEGLAALMKWRAMDLERALRNLLDDPPGRTTQALYQHPIIQALFLGRYDPAGLRASRFAIGSGDHRHMRLRDRRHLPSYIPAAQFATAFLDLVARGVPGFERAADPDARRTSAAPLTIALLRTQAAALPPHLGRAVLAAIDYADGDLAQVRQAVAHWFDGAMDRASGGYKRRTQALLFGVGLFAAVVFNVDALHVLHRLTADKAFREIVVDRAAAAKVRASASAGDEAATLRQARAELDAVALPIGWDLAPADAGASRLWATPFCAGRAGAESVDASCRFGADKTGAILRIALGWLVTAFAMMFGAPFCFDILDHVMNVRSTLKPRDRTDEAPPRP